MKPMEMNNEFELVYKFLASRTKRWGYTAQLHLNNDGSGCIGFYYRYVAEFEVEYEFDSHKELMEIVYGTK